MFCYIVSIHYWSIHRRGISYKVCNVLSWGSVWDSPTHGMPLPISNNPFALSTLSGYLKLSRNASLVWYFWLGCPSPLWMTTSVATVDYEVDIYSLATLCCRQANALERDPAVRASRNREVLPGQGRGHRGQQLHLLLRLLLRPHVQVAGREWEVSADLSCTCWLVYISTAFGFWSSLNNTSILTLNNNIKQMYLCTVSKNHASKGLLLYILLLDPFAKCYVCKHTKYCLASSLLSILHFHGHHLPFSLLFAQACEEPVWPGSHAQALHHLHRRGGLAVRFP